MSNPSPSGWHPPYGQPPQPGASFNVPRYHPGFPPPLGPPPRKTNVGIWIAICAVVLAVGVLAITGFVAPGFFLSKTQDPPQPGSTSALPAPAPNEFETETSPATASSTRRFPTNPETTVRQFLDQINAGNDVEALTIACDNSQYLVGSWLQLKLPAPRQLKIINGIPQDDVSVHVELSGTAGGEKVTQELSVTNFDERGFCVSTILPK